MSNTATPPANPPEPANDATILVERHHIPVGLYMQIYGQQINTQQPRSRYVQRRQVPSATQPRVSTPIYETTTSVGDLFEQLFSPTTIPTQQNNQDTPSQNNQDNTRARSNIRRHQTTTPYGIVETVTTTSTSNVDIPSNSSNNDVINTIFSYLLGSNVFRNTTPTNGLTPTQIRENTRLYTYGTHLDLPNTNCSVCTCDYETDDQIRKLNTCRHYFHKTCIDTWLVDNNTCPLCRSNVIVDINEID